MNSNLNEECKKINVFIIGSKGIPARYGGYETFVENLTKRKTSENIMYHVSCLSTDDKEFEYNNARCFNVKTLNIGPAKAIFYDKKTFEKCLTYIKEKKLQNSIIYVLTCRIGPFFKKLVNKAHKLGVKVYLNPDGHEWMRSKWPLLVKKYWKYSEKKMVKYSDLIICDSKNIEKYVLETYKKYNPNTRYIAYGADITKSTIDDKTIEDWMKKYNVSPFGYYLIVGRFVPENNFEIMIREFKNSNTKKDLIVVSNVEKNKLYNLLETKYNVSNDKRIKFVGTIYNEQLLKKIRELAFAYLHGHSVGGTNPSLLEALASTRLNILFDVGFNKECGNESAIYFTKEDGNLANIINECDNLTSNELNAYNEKSTHEIKERYSWEYIVSLYERTFLNRE